MTNDDLKRFYPLNNKPEQSDDFVRYDKYGRIQAENPTHAKDVVNMQTLLAHEGGAANIGNSIWYSRQNLIVDIGDTGLTESSNIAFSDIETIDNVKINDLILLASGIIGRIVDIHNPSVEFVALGYIFDNNKIIEDANSVVVDETGILFEGMTCNNAGHLTNIDISLPIIGSESIIVDGTEDGKAVELHLDAEITNKLARQLSTPMSRPASTELVAIDNTNSQVNLHIGYGLKVENGTISIDPAIVAYIQSLEAQIAALR